MGRRRTALAALAAAGTALTLVVAPLDAPAGAATATVTTPAVPSTMTWWGSAGPVAGSPAGTLFGDGTIRSTAAPHARVALAPSDAALVGAQDPMPLNQYSPWPAVSVDDVHAVGAHVTATSATGVRDAVLWAVNLGTAAVLTRTVAVPFDQALLGSAGSAWATSPYTAPGPVTLWPFDGSAPTSLALPGEGRLLAVGTAGILYLSTGDASLASRRLLLARPDGSAVTTVIDFASDPRYAAASASALTAVTADGAVGWFDGSHVGYWDAVTGALTTTCASCATGLDVAVVRGTVGVYPGHVQLSDSGTLVGQGPWLAWTTAGGALLATTAAPSPSGLVHRLWASAGTDGTPALGGLAVSLEVDGDMHRPTADRWFLWSPPAAPTVPVAGPATSAAVRSVQGALGGLLVSYQVAPPTNLPGADGTMVVLRRVGATSTTSSFTTQRAVPVDRFGLETGYGVSTPWSAVPEWSDGATTQQLVLRTGYSVLGRIPLGTARVRAVAQSGPVTLFVAGSVLRWSDPYGQATVLSRSATPRIAQDGVLAAYQTTDGWIWVRDVTAPTSRTNPRAVSRPCGRSSVACTRRLWLSAGRLVVQYAAGANRLLVVDLVHRTSSTIALADNPFCDEMSGRVLACRNGVTGRVVTLDTGATRLAFRPVAGAVLVAGAISTPTAFVGRRLARPTGVDPRTLRPTTVTVAPLPTVNADRGPTRLLGPVAAKVLSNNPITCFGWQPQWSFTDPVRAYTLVLRDPSGRVVRTWKGSAPDGWIRGVYWCPPLTASLGTYRWTLTGTSAYGAVRDVTGACAGVTGTLVVRRAYRSTVTITIPRATTAGATVTVTGRLVRRDTGVPVAGRVLTLWRSSTGTVGWALLARGVTDARGTVTWRTVVPRRMYYQVRYEGAVDLWVGASPRTLVTASG